MTSDQGEKCIAVVVPVHNEAESLPQLMAELRTVFDSMPYRWEVTFVDDGSKDGTWDAIQECVRNESSTALIRALRLSRNFGKEAAICAGLDSVECDAVIVMDGDLQHPPALIPKMVRMWESTGVDVVDAVKADRGREAARSRILAKGFYLVFNTLSGLRLDAMSDYKLVDRRVVSAWRMLPERNRFFRGLIEWLGFRHERIEFLVGDRAEGRSRWTLRQLIRLATTAVTSFSTLPIHFATVIGFVLAAAAMILGVQTLYVKLRGEAVEGFTTVILVLLIIGSALLISVGVIGEYVARIYHEVKQRPIYVIRERVVSDAKGSGGQEKRAKHV